MLNPGTLLSSRYKIQNVLGQGGMGAVYLATMEALGNKKVAVKEMELKGFSNDELAAAVTQFKKEASFLANLDHPNLVQVTDFFVEGEKHYLVMAYVTGETLQQKLKAYGRPFTWEQVKPYAEPLADVLHYLHTQDPPILFRDLKPSNIMIEDSGRLRLIDFGIARTAQAGDRTSTFLQGTGTSGFSPIEQYGGGQSTDQRSDIYALGATIYYLLTGRIPPDAVARISQGKQLIPASQHVTGIPAGMDELLAKSMAVRQHDRHASIAEFKHEMMALESGIDSEGATEDFGSLPAVGESTKTPPPTNPPAAAAGAASPKENRPQAIMVEMFPTSPNATGKQSNTPWIIGAGSMVVATIAIAAMVMNYLPGDKGKADKPNPETAITQPAKTNTASVTAVAPKKTEVSDASAASETKPKQQFTSNKPKKSYIDDRPLAEVLAEERRKKQQARREAAANLKKTQPKPTRTRRPAASLGGGKYPTGEKKSYPTGQRNPKPVEQPTQPTQPPAAQPAPPPQPVAQQPPAQRPRQPFRTNRPDRPKNWPDHLPDPPDGMPYPPLDANGNPIPPGRGRPGPGGGFPGAPGLEPGSAPRGY